MGFIQRAFTPPGTGGREAAAIQAAADAARAQTANVAAPPNLPSISAAPPAPPTFAPGQSPGVKKGQQTASSMLGVAATGGELTKGGLGTGTSGQKKTLLG